MASEQSERIKLWGIVQGVGFRPYVAKAAARLNMKGQVLNIGGLVEITLTDTADRISRFIDFLISNKPEPAEIVHIKREPTEYRHFDSFTIIKSGAGNDEAAMIPSDLAICPDCLRELYTETDPRYQHPFISCMICGPRYTIIDAIPYDRENTAMVDFSMCEFCESQYSNLTDRRFHAQTISCHQCGPQMLWRERSDEIFNTSQTSSPELSPHEKNNAILNRASDILKNGGVIAFKSVGGYNLMADPLNQEAVAKLRSIKKREAKPFAIMFRDTEQIRDFCYMSDTEERLITSSSRPIILLEHKELPYEEINKSRFIGSFLPSMAAQYMLLDKISPLISTSANFSGMPMIKDDEEMKAMMDASPYIDGMLYNIRSIRIRADDSVARVIDGQPQMIRRSKGYAPVPLYVEPPLPDAPDEISDSTPSDTMLLATGSQLKNSFALTKGAFVYMSQFFGDMDTIESQSIYKENVKRLCSLFRIKPKAVVCDMHPLYFTTAFAEEYAEKNNIPLIRVQHHHAHVASVMAENQLKGRVIGISFDGTGYGTDGCIWGGEFFICDGSRVKRAAHLKYVHMIGGDSSVRDARRSALSYLHAFDTGYLNRREKNDCMEIPIDISDIIEFGREAISKQPDASLIMSALDSGINTVMSSSMGRLFDGVAALLGIKGYNEYEGQCAIMLEDAAAFAQKSPGKSLRCDLALSFHKKIINMVVSSCKKLSEVYHTKQVAITGGTFQNKILMEGVLDGLRQCGLKPYYNISVSPNDGGIALGQAYIAMHHITETEEHRLP